MQSKQRSNLAPALQKQLLIQTGKSKRCADSEVLLFSSPERKPAAAAAAAAVAASHRQNRCSDESHIFASSSFHHRCAHESEGATCSTHDILDLKPTKAGLNKLRFSAPISA